MTEQDYQGREISDEAAANIAALRAKMDRLYNPDAGRTKKYLSLGERSPRHGSTTSERRNASGSKPDEHTH